ncbi:MAG: hypothetical protein JHC61_07120 [Burkholderiaceae bacterium]|nr:hypothetical protein [Burkholderiaceae bacterium]
MSKPLTLLAIFLALMTSSVTAASLNPAPPQSMFFGALKHEVVAYSKSVHHPLDTLLSSAYSDTPESRRILTQKDEICIYICNKEPSEGGTYCECDAYPL